MLFFLSSVSLARLALISFFLSPYPAELSPSPIVMTLGGKGMVPVTEPGVPAPPGIRGPTGTGSKLILPELGPLPGFSRLARNPGV